MSLLVYGRGSGLWWIYYRRQSGCVRAEIVISYNCSFLNYSVMISGQEEVDAVAVGL